MRRSLLWAAVALLPLGWSGEGAAQQPGHLCVGVGLTAREQAANTPYTLKLIYAEPDGHFLADVLTRISDAAGNVVLETGCDGPWLLVDLAPGRYRVTATFAGETRTVDVSVGTQKRDQLITF
ncbi:MAG: hypothetical protein R3F55_19300 [Alphaproteobacteria bacterium]